MTPAGPDVGSAVVVGLQATPTPDLGPDALAAYWPVVVRTGWFLAGFLTVVFVGRVLVRPVLARAVRRRNPNNPTVQGAVLVYFRVFAVLLAVLVGAGVAGYAGFLSGSALVISAIALAIGVAAQEVISSLVSGVALVFDPEFNVGDHIEWADGQGVVQSIALRVTRVETHGGELVTIPNTVLTTQEITRPYGRGNNRVVHDLELAYEEDIGPALRLLEDVAIPLERILAEPQPVAYVDELGDDGVSIQVHYWIRDPTRRDVFAVRSAYARAVKQRFEDAGIVISPASQRDLEGRIEVDSPANGSLAGVHREGRHEPE